MAVEKWLASLVLTLCLVNPISTMVHPVNENDCRNGMFFGKHCFPHWGTGIIGVLIVFNITLFTIWMWLCGRQYKNSPRISRVVAVSTTPPTSNVIYGDVARRQQLQPAMANLRRCKMITMEQIEAVPPSSSICQEVMVPVESAGPTTSDCMLNVPIHTTKYMEIETGEKSLASYFNTEL